MCCDPDLKRHSIAILEIETTTLVSGSRTTGVDVSEHSFFAKNVVPRWELTQGLAKGAPVPQFWCCYSCNDVCCHIRV